MLTKTTGVSILLAFSALPAHAVMNGRGQDIFPQTAIFQSSATITYTHAANAGLTVSSGLIVNNGTVGLAVSGGNVGIGTTAPAGLFQVGGGSLTVLISGNVGIGTTAPAATLDVKGTLRIGTTSGSNLFLEGIGGVVDNFRIYSDHGQGNFLKILADSTPTAYLAITSAGNLGIGTASPGGKLHVSGTAYPQVTVDDSASRTFALGVTASTFRLRDVTGAADRVTLDAAGNVGIGTASPGVKLDVNGAVKVVNQLTAPVTCTQALAGSMYYDTTGNEDLCVCTYVTGTWIWYGIKGAAGGSPTDCL